MATLFLVSTPIGNLEDLSPRAAETLRTATRILAEDTRRTRILTERVGSAAKLVSLHAHNERERVARILEWLGAGEDLALVSDAGTPLLSDPGARVVDAVLEAGHKVVPIPGPSAILAALVASGLPSERFAFLGFAPRKGSERSALLARVAQSQETVVLFESPQRVVGLLESLSDTCGQNRRAAVARELTKVHEEVNRGTLDDLSAYYREHTARGEVTVVVAPAAAAETTEDLREEARRVAERLLSEGMKPSEVAKELATRLDLARNDAYRLVQDATRGTEGADPE